MAMGMTCDEYWNGDVRLTRYYYEAEKLRQERDNVNAWWAGQYIYDAVSAAIHNNFREKTAQLVQYPTKPYPISETKEEKQEREDQEALIAEAYMQSFVQAGANWGKK